LHRTPLLALLLAVNSATTTANMLRRFVLFEGSRRGQGSRVCGSSSHFVPFAHTVRFAAAETPYFRIPSISQILLETRRREFKCSPEKNSQHKNPNKIELFSNTLFFFWCQRKPKKTHFGVDYQWKSEC